MLPGLSSFLVNQNGDRMVCICAKITIIFNDDTVPLATMEGLELNKAKLDTQARTSAPQHSTTGTYLVDNRPRSLRPMARLAATGGVVQRVLGLEKGTQVEVNNGKVPWYGEIVEVKGEKYVIRMGGGTDKDVQEVAHEHVKLHPVTEAMKKVRTLEFDGQHGTNAAKNVESLAQGLDYQKQMAGGGDGTQYSGPGFYYFPHTAAMAKDAKGYGHDHKLDIYTAGLHAETRLNDDSSEVLRSSGSLNTNVGNIGAGKLKLTKTNHPMNMWTERSSDQGKEKVIRPHLYDKGQLLHALKVAAALPVAGDARDSVPSKDDRDEEIILQENAEETAFANTSEPKDEPEAMDHAGNQKFTDWENGNRPGHEIIEKKYGDLKMPYAIFKILVNVAEFDFKARANTEEVGTPKHEPTVSSFGDSLGESILPSKEELAAIITAAVKENPTWYHKDDHEK